LVNSANVVYDVCFCCMCWCTWVELVLEEVEHGKCAILLFFSSSNQAFSSVRNNSTHVVYIFEVEYSHLKTTA
jgi:hypothetical protein